MRDCSGAKSVEVVSSRELKKREKALTEDYIAAYKLWRKNKSEPKPSKLIFRSLQKLKGKCAKTDAEALAAKLQQKLDEKKRAKEKKELDSLDKAQQQKSTRAKPAKLEADGT